MTPKASTVAGSTVAGPLPVLLLAGRAFYSANETCRSQTSHPELPLGSGQDRMRSSYENDRSQSLRRNFGTGLSNRETRVLLSRTEERTPNA